MRRFLIFIALAVMMSLIIAVLSKHAVDWVDRRVTQPEPDQTPADTAEEAYQYLLQLPRRWSGTSARDCKTYSPAHIRRLEPSFALQVARMVQAWRAETGKDLTILSAFRTREDQRCVCEGELGPCAGWRTVRRTKDGQTYTEMVPTGERSEHEYGRAIDLRPGSRSTEDFAQFRRFLRERPEFGLHLPLWNIGDRPHVEAIRPKQRR